MLAGGLSARWSVFMAGVQGASDPEHVVKPQRDRIVRGQSQGAARATARVESAQSKLGSPAILS